ncbi:MAG: HdeD family acid-resistance protein [Terriglobia bacterium]
MGNMIQSMWTYRIEEVQRFWKWFLALGIGLVLLGMIALGASVGVTLASVLLFGALFLISGVIQTVQAFQTRQSKGFFLHLLAGVFDLVIGVLLVTHPTAGALALTLLLAAFFMVGGLFRSIAALSLRFPNWGWALVGGIVSLFLGVLLWMEWPESGLWFIGMCIGIDMIFHGWAWVMLALAARAARPTEFQASQRDTRTADART